MNQDKKNGGQSHPNVQRPPFHSGLNWSISTLIFFAYIMSLFPIL